MTLSLAYSPCPNDTFIFDALVHHKINTKGLKFEVTYLDVQQLNVAAENQTFDISKLSYYASAQLLDKYQILRSGGALGFGCGPLLISKNKIEIAELSLKKIAIPGKNTTAYFLLQYAFPQLYHVEEMLFSDIEEAVLSGKVDAGLIIHENRFTYGGKGLQKILDLGELWEEKTNNPIPLGCIGVRRDMDDELKILVQNLIRESVEYAWKNPQESKEYIKKHAQELADQVIQSHIDLYVNQYSADLGEDGKKAVEHMFSTIKILPEKMTSSYIFVD
ncbi:MAG: 1,4-dihydroxy-6-naphthoate synthase [Saprospiraceae bacterium]